MSATFARAKIGSLTVIIPIYDFIVVEDDEHNVEKLMLADLTETDANKISWLFMESFMEKYSELKKEKHETVENKD
jgi:hypothetical protein